MPPPLLPRSSMSSLTRCRSSQILPIQSRTFTSSTRLSAIGPEKPGFIPYITTLQPEATPRRDIKGTLPPPRNIFPTRGKDKATVEYIAFVTAEPKSAKSLKEPANERVAWKRRMAELRRTNLREGIVELKKRQTDEQYFHERRSKVKRRERTLQANAPQREDERLTNPTITAAMSKLQAGAVPDPDREQRVAEKKARVAARELAKEEARKDALHTLYMHARDFITTEEQLNQKVEEIFIAEPFTGHKGVENIWEAFGSPNTVKEMVNSVNGTQKSALDFHEGPAVKTSKQMKKIAEELTGGKMD